MNNFVRGFKAFRSDWTCDPTGEKPFQYEVGKSFTMPETPQVCSTGFHFCRNILDCFYFFECKENKTKFAEVVAFGDIDRTSDGRKLCTNKIKIVREISWEEALELANHGAWNSGIGNTGTGNSGDFNFGCDNSGSYNVGSDNSGDFNNGDYNSGNQNNGNYNGGFNNTGSYNLGNYNSGDFNSCDFSVGVFNTINKDADHIVIFNKPSNWSNMDWYQSKAREILYRLPEKIGNNRQEWWEALNCEEKTEVLSLPNFDCGIFKEITSIDVSREWEEFSKFEN